MALDLEALLKTKGWDEMNVVQQVKPRPFAWSYSKLKNYETCARRYSEVELKKSVQEAKSDELARGDALHEAMKSRVGSDKTLPPEFIYMESWAKKLTKELSPFQIIQCELKLAVDKQGRPVGFFDRDVWLRGRIDYLRIIPVMGSDGRATHDIGHLVDYKTGKPKEDWTQLMLQAHLVFCHYHNLQEMRTEFLWTEYSDTMHENFKRFDMDQAISGITPRVIKLEQAHKTGVFEPNPCGLCRDYCPVVSCEYHGKSHRRVSQ